MADDLKIHREGYFIAGMSMLLVVAACFIWPIALPQTACDVFGSLMACRDGGAPTCANVPAPGGRRNEKELAAICRSGERVSTTPISAASALSAVPVVALMLTLVLKGLQKRA